MNLYFVDTSSIKVSKYLKIIAICIILAIALEIWMVNRLATYGNKIAQLNSLKSALELENQLLENKVADKSSILTLEEKAKALGFESIKNIEYVKPQTVASHF